MLHNRSYRVWVIASVSVGLFVSVLDQTAVFVAIPALSKHFQSPIQNVSLVLIGYMLTTGALLLPMGRAADIFGLNKIHTLGLVIFVISAGLAGASFTLTGLILSRMLQGVGAAMVQATAMAIVTSVFPEKERGKAIGALMTVIGVAAASAPIISGVVQTFLGWRYVFFMSLPFGIFAVLASLRVLKAQGPAWNTPSKTKEMFDWHGALFSTVAITSFLILLRIEPVVLLSTLGLTSWHWEGQRILVVICLFATICATMGFIVVEKKSPSPMLPLNLFAKKQFSLGISANFITFIASGSLYFVLPTYLTSVLGYSTIKTGFLISCAAVWLTIGGPIIGYLSDRFGWWRFAVAGMIFYCSSFILLSTITSSSTLMIILALSFTGCGMAAFYTPNVSMIISTVDRTRYGITVAFLHMARNTANMIGVAISSAILGTTLNGLGSSINNTFMLGAVLTGLALILTISQRKQPLPNLAETLPEEPQSNGD